MRDFQKTGRSTVMGCNAMVATSTPLAAQVAIEMLRSGGNAMDAAISGAVMLGLCEPQMTGIGGDCFALIKTKQSDEIIALNGSGRAPKAVRPDDLRSKGHETVPPYSAHAVTVPGAIDAFCYASEHYGSKGIDAILAPSIKYMREGIPIGARTAFDWANDHEKLQGAARQFFLKNGTPYKAGEIFALPRQADVLERVAAHGRDGFYEGEVAEDMVASLRAAGGLHTLEDFSSVKCSESAPIKGTYKGHELIEHAPNGQGATAILMQNILAHFDLPSLEPMGAARVHLEAEATKLAYDARNRIIADPDFTARLDHMLSLETAEKLAALIDPQKARADIASLSEAVHKETIYITVVDQDRMMVSLIYSLFHGFGSGLASEKFGINFQNRGAGFTLERGHPNELGGGKRPMHTIIPAFLSDAKGIRMPFGVMGGAYQPCGHARVVTNLVDYQYDIQAALDAPRSFYDNGALQLETGYSDAIAQELTERGHEVLRPQTPIGGAQAIWIDPDTGVLHGASDPRKDGCALGY